MKLKLKDPGALCVICADPGRCCRAFPLNYIAPTCEKSCREILDRNGLTQFKLITVFEVGLLAAGVGNEKYIHYCDWLDESGQCSEYKRRPEFPCKVFVPGSDPLCIYHGLVEIDPELEKEAV